MHYKCKENLSYARGMSAPPNMFCWNSRDSLHIIFSSHSQHSTFSLLHWIDAEIKWALSLCGSPKVKFSFFLLFYNRGVWKQISLSFLFYKNMLLTVLLPASFFSRQKYRVSMDSLCYLTFFNNSALCIFPDGGKSLRAMQGYWSLKEVQKGK